MNEGTYRGTSFVIHDLSRPSDDTSRKRMISHRPFFRIVLPAGTELTEILPDVWLAKETHEPDIGSVRSRSNTLCQFDVILQRFDNSCSSAPL